MVAWSGTLICGTQKLPCTWKWSQQRVTRTSSDTTAMKFSTLEELKVRQWDVFGRLFESVRRQVGQNWPVQDSRGFIFSVPKTQPEAGTVRHGCLVWNTDLWYTKTALYVEVVAATSYANLIRYHSHEILHFGGAEGTPMGRFWKVV